MWRLRWHGHKMTQQNLNWPPLYIIALGINQVFLILILILSSRPAQEHWQRWRRARSTWRRAKWTRRRWRASTSAATSSRAPRWRRSSTSTTSACVTSKRRCSTTCSSRSPSSRKSRASWRRPCRNTTTPNVHSDKKRRERKKEKHYNLNWAVAPVMSFSASSLSLSPE